MTDSIRERVIDLGRAVARAGLVVGAGGNIAARVTDDRMWVTPTGWSLADLGAANLVQVSLDGRRLEGALAPTSELLLHLAALQARRDVRWSMHLHPPMATLLPVLDIPIRTITTDHAFYLRDIATVPYLRPGSAELANAAAAELAAAPRGAPPPPRLRRRGSHAGPRAFPGRQPRGGRQGYLPSPIVATIPPNAHHSSWNMSSGRRLAGAATDCTSDPISTTITVRV